ncbi:MAG TPA: sigma 54-interacting transcriptional regulator [Methylomirabilota bacterium]
MRTVARAAAIGLLATAVAAGVALPVRAAVTAFEWSFYDLLPAQVPAGQPPIAVVRDAASESRFGSGVWDRALLARLVTGLSQAGAAVIGLEAALDRPSAPGRGGAGSDALLSQAIGLAGNVVLTIALEPAGPLTTHDDTEPRYRLLGGSPPVFAQHAKGVAHTLAVTDPDGVVRRVPLFVRVGESRVPAYGLALATALENVDVARIPVDRDDNVLVPPAGSRGPRVRVVSFSDIWSSIEERQLDALRSQVADRTVLVLAEPRAGIARTVVQANLFDRIQGRAWLREAPTAWMVLASALLATLVAFLGLALRWWTAAIAAVVLALAYAAGVAFAASAMTLLLPLAVPLLAAAVAAASAPLWTQLGSAYRVRHLEDEVTAIREGLVRQESAVEALEEDLEAARAAVARSTGGEESLRAQLAAAREQEERSRARLEELEQRVRAVGSADVRETPLGDAELERLRGEAERLGIVTRDPAMLALVRDLEKAARSALPILLAGEPGTGKELFARAAHRLSARAEGPFVAVNMGAIPAELFESEMFGHVRGSFTGAVADRKGMFEQANRGTIFLDEVGELRPEHQSKLLRVLQDKSFYRVGATRPTTVDVRIVAASNRDLVRGSAEGWFREDLYFRLKGLVIRLSPLRERPHDVPLLAERFVREAAAEAGRPPLPLSEAALAALERNDWPGNARELQNCLRQALALADGAAIMVADLRLPIREPVHEDSGGDEAVLDSLRRHGFDMQATARSLGWDRSTVTQRLKGLGFRALVDSQGDRGKAALALAGDPALVRTVELKLREYSDHLLRVVEGFGSPDEAVTACRKRFKNLPERHFRSLELLVRQHLERRWPTARV